VDGEPVGTPEVYGTDRLFAYIRLTSDDHDEQDAKVGALEKAGHPVVRIEVSDPHELGGEFFRWEFATAVAGSLIGIDPFDQPDVEDAKVLAREITDRFDETGALPSLTPFVEKDGLRLSTDDANRAELIEMAGENADVPAYVSAHLSRAGADDYVALLAYVEMTTEHEAALRGIRALIRDARCVATCVGFGPRFQHSTGQAYKGGPNTGVFLQITCDDSVNLAVPGHRYSFGIVKEAEARSDLDVLAARGRRVLRLHVGADVGAGLERLRAGIDHSSSTSV
jgi:transaldolase/glucose-6-phosphate isomerase